MMPAPDSVISILFLEARLNGVAIPVKTMLAWTNVIDAWERAGNSDAPERSWPVLASALAHQYLGNSSTAGDRRISYVEAWSHVLTFAVEILMAKYDPNAIPLDASGSMLDRARAAFRREKHSYSEKIARAEVRRLLLPVRNVPRQQSIDAIFIAEKELSGIFKVLVRNDPDTTLGKGYTLMLMERSDLYSSNPSSWMTISTDPRSELDLTALWYELERLETAAWGKKGEERPLRDISDRQIDKIPLDDQPYRECWWITKDRSLIGSPYHQVPQGAHKDQTLDFPGSLLTALDVKTALFSVYDPSVQAMVIDLKKQKQVNLLDTVADTGKDEQDKLLLSARWASAEPMPISNINEPWSGIFPCALHAMAARTCGIAPRQALVEAGTYANQMVLRSLPGGFAVVTASGSFLLDTGGAALFDYTAAKRIFFDQALLAKQLDELQLRVLKISESRRKLHRENKRMGEKVLLVQQQECTRLMAELASLRGALNQPLTTSEAGLQPFKNALSTSWNIEARISELADQVDWLQSSARTTAELRIFRLGRTIATISFPFIIADTASGTISRLVTTYFNNYTADFPIEIVKDISFGGLLLLSFLAIHLILWRDR